MLNSQVSFSAICFSAFCLSASVGFAQEYYQPVEMYSQSYTSYPVETEQYSSDQISISNFTPTQVSAYESVGVTTQTYGGFTVVQEGGVVQESGVLANTIEGTIAQGDIVQGDAVYGSDIHGQQVGGVIISPDYGYEGPGDMRYHLWNDHGDDLKASGVSKSQLDAMSMEKVQKWHNFFHGTQGRPE